MYKYNGVLIHQSHDDDGFIEVVERDGMRSLHFGTLPRQSSMYLREPDKLALDYVRAMACFVLFKELHDDEVLVVGLGGGSISKFLLKHFPDCRLKVIETRPSVVKIARSHFGLPLDPRLKIIIDDGGRYVRQRSGEYQQRFSAVIVDAFDHDGMAESIYNKAFYEACQAVLTEGGILAINLWGGTGNVVFQQVALWLGQVFDWNIIFLPVQGKSNIIGLAFNKPSPYQLTALRDRAAALEPLYQVEFPHFLKELKRHNASTIENIIKL